MEQLGNACSKHFPNYVALALGQVGGSELQRELFVLTKIVGLFFCIGHGQPRFSLPFIRWYY